MTVHRDDNQQNLDTFMRVAAGPLSAMFQGGKIYDVSARQSLHEFISYDNTSAHEDHVKEYRYNIAWRNWAMINDLAEKVWLHYQGTFDKMLAILTSGSVSATPVTSAFDQVMRTTTMTTFQLIKDKNGRLTMESQLTEGGNSPKHIAENIITGCGEVTITHVLYTHFLKLLESDEKQLLVGIGCNFYMLDRYAMICTRHFVSFRQLLSTAAMSGEHSDLQTRTSYQDNEAVCPLFETTAQSGVTTLKNQ
jgi:hypothetical protein